MSDLSDLVCLAHDHGDREQEAICSARFQITALRSKLTTAERERDEARREREAAKEKVLVLESQLLDERYGSSFHLDEARNRAEAAEHRAERAEAVVEAANAIYDARNETEDWDARSRLMDALKEYLALDAAEGTNA